MATTVQPAWANSAARVNLPRVASDATAVDHHVDKVAGPTPPLALPGNCNSMERIGHMGRMISAGIGPHNFRPPSRRSVLAGGLGALAGLALPQAAQGAENDALAYVHPELRAVAETLARTDQAAEPELPVHLPIPAGVRTVTVPGRAGAPSVTVYLANQAAGPPRGAILYLHGGGFIRGSALLTMPLQIALARRLNCVLASVEYRLAPGTPFPGALEDNYAALLWLHANAAALGIDARRIALYGESAGGGHAAMLAIAARDRGEVAPCFQALVYPMLDDRTGSAHSVPAHRGTLIWTVEENRRGWTALLGRKAGSRKVPAGAVPARVQDLSGLPPAWIGVGGIDLFVDEDIEYARRLLDAGVPAELLVVPGAFHGFQLMAPQAAISREFNASLEAALARALA